MRVHELAEHDRAAWDEYVHSTAGSGIFHLSGWKDVMERTFGHETHFLIARQGDQFLGVLPLLHVRSRLGGHYLTSMPGGLCAEDDEAAAALLETAKGMVRSTRAQYLIIRDSLRAWPVPGMVTDQEHCTLVAPVSADWEQVRQRISRRSREQRNQAARAGVEVVSGPETLDRFYPTYSRAMWEKGTPTFGIRFFRNILAQFPAHFDVLMVQRGSQVLGGWFVASFRDTVYCTWAGILSRFYRLKPSHVLYWETLRFGSENGFQWLDFGRSRWDSGTFVFKKRWGGEPRPLYQQFYLNGLRHSPPVGSSREREAGYRLFAMVWKHLPLPLAELLGPRLRKRMPFG